MRCWIAALLGISASLWAENVPIDMAMPSHQEPQAAWFTGPLLTPSGNNIPEGHLNLEPYVFATYSASHYNEDWKRVENGLGAWDINVLVILQVGVTPWLDFTLTPTWITSIANGSTTFSLGDCYAAFGLQLLKQSPTSWYPSVKLSFGETFPIGRFESLDPEQFGTDAAGAGSYLSRVLLTLGWKLHLWDIHWVQIRLSASGSIGAKVRVHGFSAYGGAFDTNGWVYPGTSGQLFFGFEFNLTQRWVFAFDALANFNSSIRFKGFPGFDEITGLPADLSSGSSAQYSMAPAIEYNWNQNLGLISGVWFTFAGRNASAFTSWVTALNYFY